ncbi:CapA family protein [Geothrix sp. PMB-07]|uniref:CapA family protein n=1 Tax=Geothrix sp. PMB-07 TaxID=3068640 RepID=UPI002740E080|nr:CapA family protein [Geothrix sp. PMB-07]WLT33570.1 CapA family protein [Geothrix sp. PMB-07]
MRSSVPGGALGLALLMGLTLGIFGCRAKPKPAPPAPITLSLVAVGDIMMHQDVKAAATRDLAGFPALWADLVPLFQGADLAFGNLETPVAPATGRPGVPFQFNAPETLPSALRASGFTVLSTANNHAFDQGAKGVRETLERLHAERLVAVGSGLDQAQAESLQIVERQGVRVAFLGFTDIFNLDLNHRATEPWVRPLDLEPALQAVREARTRAELVVVSIHWGNEYQHQPTKRQKDIAQALVAAGCDVLLGHHPHVLQPMELLDVEGRKALVAYSLGNFISNQDRMYRADLFPVAGGDSRDGAALKVRFEGRRQADGRVHMGLAQVETEPLWTENNWGASSGQRSIRVIRVASAEARVRAELDHLNEPRVGAPPPLDDATRRKVILEKQEYLRTLLLRRQRIANILGEAFVLQGIPAPVGTQAH